MRDTAPIAPSREDVGEWQAKLRAALFDGVTEKDVKDIVANLVKQAKAGDLASVKLLFGYVLGGQGTVKVENAVILPAAPTEALPGSEEKIRAMAARVAHSKEVFSMDDRRRGVS